jgi:L,D-transpeptidase catalytic domain
MLSGDGNPIQDVIQHCLGKVSNNFREQMTKRLNQFQPSLIALIWVFTCSANAAEIPQAKSMVKTNPQKFYSVAEVLKEYELPVHQKLGKIFASQNISYPPKSMTWICLKAERQLMLFAKDDSGKMRKVLTYPIIGASGKAGPKLQEGDMQVPEGFYKITGFRPNLIAHIGLDVNYPNATDRLHANEEKRHHLGSDILIHGSRWSTGCLAMGNEPIEEMFVLAHDTGINNISLIFAPCDLTKVDVAKTNALSSKASSSSAPTFRSWEKNANVEFPQQPKWLPGLYLQIRKALSNFPI